MDISLSEEYYENIHKALEAVKEAANGIYEMLSECIQAVCEAVSELIDGIDWNTFLKEAVDSLKLHRKPTHNYQEYNYTKPNTKPYSTYKRLYRVQVR